MVIFSDPDYELLQSILRRAKHQSSLPSREIVDVEFEEVPFYCSYLGIANVKECSMFPRDINRVAP